MITAIQSSFRKILSPIGLLLAASTVFGQYSYYYTKDFTDGNDDLSSHWSINGTPDLGSWGVRAYIGGGPANLSLISTDSVPAGSNNYEAKVTFVHASMAVYLRASSTANYFTNSGTFYAVTYQSGTLALYKRVSGTTTQLASTSADCGSGDCVIRAIISGSTIHVHLNSVWRLAVTDSSIASGMPGIGTDDGYSSSTYGYGIRKAELGALETTAPVPGGSGTVSSSIFPNRVDLQWQGATDAGSGVWRYAISRNGTLLQYTRTAEFTDATVSAATSYTYLVTVHDYHGNTANMSSLSVTTPASGSTDPRRVGVQSNSAYWGDMGEQIDMRSGNVNFTMPLVTARGREDTSVGLRAVLQQPAVAAGCGRDLEARA